MSTPTTARAMLRRDTHLTTAGTGPFCQLLSYRQAHRAALVDENRLAHA